MAAGDNKTDLIYQFMDEEVTLESNNASSLNNGTPYPGADEFVHSPSYITIYVTVVNVIVFCIGTVGNILVIIVVCKVRAMRTPTNYFLFNLSVADLLVLLVCQPVALMEFYNKERWYIGEVMCKMAPLLENGMLHVSILTIIAMTTERFYAIIYPFKKQANCSDSRTVKTIIILWIFAFLVTSPFLFITKLEDAIFYDGSAVKVCRTHVYLTWHHVFIQSISIGFFVLPFFILVYMYARIIRQLMADSLCMTDMSAKLTHRSRKQVVRMLITIIILFFMSMCPIRVVSFWQIYTPVETLHNVGIEKYNNIIWVARIMMYVNSATNPIVYCLASSKFKVAFKRIFKDCRKKNSWGSKRASSESTHVLFRRSRKRAQKSTDNRCDSQSSPCIREIQDEEAVILRIKFSFV